MTAFAASPAEAQGDLTQFAATPLWLTLIKILVVFVVLILLTLFTTYFERRVIARLQQRIGPNRVGPAGLLQPLADGLKLAFKQGIIPRDAHVLVYLLAPMIAATCAFLTFAVIPVGPEVSIFGVVTPLQITDFPESVLYVFAVVSIGVYGVVLAGWASGSTYSLLGALRSTAQLISYEIAMGLSFVAVFLYAGSMSTSQIVEGQVDTWYIVLLLPSFVIYAVSMVGETNRAPFDLPEAEGELVAGFMTEYSGLRWAMFFLAEYIAMINVAAVATTLFLGGWRAPPHLHGVGRSERGLVADPLVLRQGLRVPVRVRVAARLAAADALRPVHAARLAGAHPGGDRLGRAGRHAARGAQRVHGRHPHHLHHPRRDPRGAGARADRHGLPARRAVGGAGGGAGVRPVRRRVPGAAAARAAPGRDAEGRPHHASTVTASALSGTTDAPRPPQPCRVPST